LFTLPSKVVNFFASLLKWLTEELFMLLVLFWVREIVESFNARREAYQGKEDFLCTNRRNLGKI